MNYKQILRSENTATKKIQKTYYERLILNNICFISDLEELKNSLFESSDSNEIEEQLVFIFEYCLKQNHAMFRVTDTYLQKIENWITILLKDKEYAMYEKRLKKLLEKVKEQKNFYKKSPKYKQAIFNDFIYMHGLANEPIVVDSTFLKRIVSSDFLVYASLVKDELEPLYEEHCLKSPIFALGSMFYTIQNLSLNERDLIPSLEEKICHLKINSSCENILLKKVLGSFEQYVLRFQEGNVLFFPTRPKLMYQLGQEKGKMLVFKK